MLLNSSGQPLRGIRFYFLERFIMEEGIVLKCSRISKEINGGILTLWSGPEHPYGETRRGIKGQRGLLNLKQEHARSWKKIMTTNKMVGQMQA
jgi:hypothetical protein